VREGWKADEQASRCSQCGVPFCQTHCPLHNNIPDWLKLTAEGRLEEAYELSAATNEHARNLRPHLPAGPAVRRQLRHRARGHGTVTIGAVEKYITDTAWEKGWVKPLRRLRRERAQSVGIIGAGPAGLAAAEQLRRGLPGHMSMTATTARAGC
jgi:glutamate synthase (NADPH/NADH) small chain